MTTTTIRNISTVRSETTGEVFVHYTYSNKTTLPAFTATTEYTIKYQISEISVAVREVFDKNVGSMQVKSDVATDIAIEFYNNTSSKWEVVSTSVCVVYENNLVVRINVYVIGKVIISSKWRIINIYLTGLEYNSTKINTNETVESEFEYKINYKGYDEAWFKKNIGERVTTDKYNIYDLYERAYNNETQQYEFVPRYTQDDVAPPKPVVSNETLPSDYNFQIVSSYHDDKIGDEISDTMSNWNANTYNFSFVLDKFLNRTNVFTFGNIYLMPNKTDIKYVNFTVNGESIGENVEYATSTTTIASNQPSTASTTTSSPTDATTTVAAGSENSTLTETTTTSAPIIPSTPKIGVISQNEFFIVSKPLVPVKISYETRQKYQVMKIGIEIQERELINSSYFDDENLQIEYYNEIIEQWQIVQYSVGSTEYEETSYDKRVKFINFHITGEIVTAFKWRILNVQLRPNIKAVNPNVAIPDDFQVKYVLKVYGFDETTVKKIVDEKSNNFPVDYSLLYKLEYNTTINSETYFRNFPSPAIAQTNVSEIGNSQYTQKMPTHTRIYVFHPWGTI
jgi:hypothetical protein